MNESELINEYRGRRVLVTGGASFIGSHLVSQLLLTGAHVTIVDDLSSGSRANIAAVEADVETLVGDVRDQATVNDAMAGQEIVFHLAAIHGGRGFVDTHGFDCLGNLSIDNAVMRAAGEANAERVVLASSACIYPTFLQDRAHSEYLLREQDANLGQPGVIFPDGDYGWAKLIGELQLRSMERAYGVVGVACRLFSVYGPRQSLSHSVTALIARATARQDPYVVWGSGSQTRNFTYVEDTVTGLLLAGATRKPPAAVNVGTDTHVSIDSLCGSIFQLLGWRPLTMEHDERQPVGVMHRAADGKLAAELGWQAKISLSVGLEQTVAWYQTSGAQITEAALFARG